MHNWSKQTTYVSVALMAAGFLLIVLAWNGAASIDFVQGQVPFLISGGVAGLGLVAGGLTLAVIQELRRSTDVLAGRLDALTELVSGGLFPAGAGSPTAVPESKQVVAGATSYHKPSCHLVESRSDLQVMAVDAAAERGLAPCRVCEPATAAAS